MMFDNPTNKKIETENESGPNCPVPRKFLIICLVGLILFAGGLALATGSHLLKGNNDYGYYTDYHSMDNFMMVRTAGVIMAEIGPLISVSGLLSASFLSCDIDRQMRVGLLGSGFGLLFMLLIFTLIFGLT